MLPKDSLGQEGEKEAVRFLQNNGYRIETVNFRTPIGEVDIIAREGKTLCFIEVKTRRSQKYGHPIESITKGKQQQITKGAIAYLLEHNLVGIPARFDVISIQWGKNGEREIELFKNAFEMNSYYNC